MDSGDSKLTFGGRLRAARKAARLTQKQLAAKVGMSQAQVSELEKGLYAESAKTSRLAHELQVRAIWLAEGKGPRTQREEVTPWNYSKIDLSKLVSLKDGERLALESLMLSFAEQMGIDLRVAEQLPKVATKKLSTDSDQDQQLRAAS